MTPSIQERAIGDVVSVVSSIAEHITKIFVDNFAPTYDSLTLGVDSSTQTDFDCWCERQCKCSAVKSDASASRDKDEMLSKADECGNADSAALPVTSQPLPVPNTPIPVPPPMPMVVPHPPPMPMVVPPPPPMPMVAPLPPPMPMMVPPPPPMPMVVPPPQPMPMMAPPPPPPPMMGHSTLPNMNPAPCVGLLTRSFNTIPQKNTKLKTLHWKKLPQQKIAKSFWANTDVKLPVLRVDFEKMQELFGQKPMKAVEKKAKQPETLTLLSDKRSLLVNVFLAKQNVETIIDSLNNGGGLNADNLKALMKLMPEKKEIADIKAHVNSTNLGKAEKFFLHLSDIKDCELRVQAMLYREEFEGRSRDALVQLDRALDNCDFLINDCNLKRFLTLVLQLGNQLNAGTNAGNAAGFKLSSLSQLTATKANTSKINFLHFIVEVAAANDSSLLNFRTKFADLQNMLKMPITAIEEEVKSLFGGFNEIKKLKTSEVSSKFEDFFRIAKEKVDALVKKVELVREMRKKIAVHFCEEPATFKLEECFAVFADFFDKVNAVMKENEEMKFKEEQAKIRTERNSDKRSSVRRKITQNDVDQLIRDVQMGKY